MRSSLLTFAFVALAAASIFAASAFNYADLAPRTVDATVVTDDNGYLAIASHDTDYACYVAYTNGKIDVTWDGGTSCDAAATGTGVNPNSVYYFHDVLKLTNKGTKTLTNVWLNMSSTDITLNTNVNPATMETVDTYAQNVILSTNLAPGETWYIGFKIDASAYDTSNGPITTTLSIEGRSSL